MWMHTPLPMRPWHQQHSHTITSKNKVGVSMHSLFHTVADPKTTGITGGPTGRQPVTTLSYTYKDVAKSTTNLLYACAQAINATYVALQRAVVRSSPLVASNTEAAFKLYNSTQCLSR